MQQTLSAIQSPEYLQPVLKLHNFDIAQAIYHRKIQVSMSQLIGCDYIFVKHAGNNQLVSKSHLSSSIQEIIDLLEVSGLQAVVTLIDTSHTPVKLQKCEFKFINGRVTNVSVHNVGSEEQTSFLLMMLDCSTNY